MYGKMKNSTIVLLENRKYISYSMRSDVPFFLFLLKMGIIGFYMR